MDNLLKTKRCLRCGGNLFREDDRYGSYLVCIQCGANYPAHVAGLLVKTTAPKPVAVSADRILSGF